MKPPSRSEYAPFYDTYVSKVSDLAVLEILANAPRELAEVLSPIPQDLENFAYAAGKWSVREALGHVIDVERLFVYRAMHIARGDSAELPGMDQEVWASAANYDQRPLVELLEEFAHLRRANHAFILSLDPHALARTGMASGHSITARALVFVVAGHELHHRQVFQTHYLPGILSAPST